MALADDARRLAAEIDADRSDPAAALSELMEALALERPDVLARSRERAALAALELPSSTTPEVEPARSRRRKRRTVKVPTPRLRAAVRPGQLVAQVLGLVALYWVLANSATAARALAGVGRAIDWLRDPAGVVADRR
jgi:hypothetical protein